MVGGLMVNVLVMVMGIVDVVKVENDGEKDIDDDDDDDDRRVVSLFGKVPVYRVRGSGSIPGRTIARDLLIIEEMVLPFSLTTEKV